LGMTDFSEEAIRANCPHCDPTSHSFEYTLEKTEDFYVVCDANPIEEGHLLIIPKAHLSCIGEYPPELYDKFIALHQKVSNFVRSTYGSVGVFEHGKLGQTVFHSHVHYLPFAGKPEDIIPEGTDKIQPLSDLADLRAIFEREKGYLFFGIDDQHWTVDTELAAPRFFRDRFAVALKVPERGNWKAMREDPEIMKSVKAYNDATQAKWESFKTKN
jgi:diadenosine tetraphosphate (Ap4A) HIT family hydrolase